MSNSKCNFIISWDNPKPANSSKMLSGLKKYGKLGKLSTKTTVIFKPYSKTNWRKIRNTIKLNLDPNIGKAFYVNTKSMRTFQIDAKNCFHWKEVK